MTHCKKIPKKTRTWEAAHLMNRREENPSPQQGQFVMEWGTQNWKKPKTVYPEP
jgi:hypothetical protein